MLGFIGRYWRGEGSFWPGLVLFSVGLPLALAIAIPNVAAVMNLSALPSTRIVVSAAMVALLGAVGLWQLVGTWRASSKAKAAGRSIGTRWIARILAALSAVVSAVFVAMAPGGIAHIRATATDTDEIGKMGYTLTVTGNRLVARGATTWGLHDAFLKALAANPDIKTVELNGPGGHVAVGLRLADAIKARKLDTLTTEMCASACTIMFGAGQRRLLKAGAKLGFHAQTPTYSKGGPDPVLRLSDERTRAFWRAAGVPPRFVDRIFETPGESLWTPTDQELLEAKVVTAIVR